MEESPTAEVRSTVRRFMQEHSGVEETRRLADAVDRRATFDDATWRRLVEQLGVTALTVPEETGGLGLGLGTMSAVLEETGRELYPGPLRSVALAVEGLRALRAAGHAAVVDPLLEAVASGELLPTLAVASDYRDRGCGLVVTADGTLRGAARAVPDGLGAGLLVALCLDEAGRPVLAAIDLTDLPDERRVPLVGIDFARAHADLELDGRSALVVVDDAAVVRRVTDRVQVLVAAEQVGLARGCLSRTIDYLGIREQFGKVIGSYQALQHRCADLAVAIESAAGLVEVASSAADAEDEELLTQIALLARARATDVSLAAAAAMIQLHGGIGFTWEHPAHLFFRHAHVTAAWFGGSAELYEEATERGCFSLIAHEPTG